MEWLLEASPTNIKKEPSTSPDGQGTGEQARHQGPLVQ